MESLVSNFYLSVAARSVCYSRSACMSVCPSATFLPDCYTASPPPHPPVTFSFSASVCLCLSIPALPSLPPLLSFRSEPSPTRTLKWPGRYRVQITCNTWSAYHVQHVVLRATRYEGTAELLSLTEFKSHLSELYFTGGTIN